MDPDRHMDNVIASWEIHRRGGKLNTRELVHQFRATIAAQYQPGDQVTHCEHGPGTVLNCLPNGSLFVNFCGCLVTVWPRELSRR